MPRQTMSPVQKSVSTTKRRTTTRRTSKKTEAPISESTIRPSTSSQSTGGGMQIVVLAIVILLLAGGGYYWFMQKQVKQSDAVYQDYQIPLGVNVPAVQEQPAAEVWQKYQDELAQYSFEYPPNWSIATTSTNGNKRVMILGSEASTTISVATTRTPKPLAQYVSELDALAKTAAAGKPSINVAESRDVAVNEVPVIARRQTLLGTGQQELIAYFGIKDYVVSIAVTDTQISTSSLQMYETLVNSFALVASTTPTVATTTATTTPTATSTQGVQ